MGRKFRKYLPKGYSRKRSKSQNECSDSEAQSEVVTTDTGSQTVDVEYIPVETQTEAIVNTASTTSQTEGGSVNDVGIQTEGRSINDVGVQTEAKEDYLCIGNNDEKFAPLVTKHDGVFKDVSGMHG